MVQKFVDDVTQNAKRAGLSKDEAVRLEKMKAEREQTKAEKKARELEMLMLFQPALTKKQKEEKAAKEAAAKAAAAKAKEEEGPEIIDARKRYSEGILYLSTYLWFFQSKHTKMQSVERILLQQRLSSVHNEMTIFTIRSSESERN